MDDVVERILTTYGTITVFGASGDPAKAAHRVPALMQRHGWRIIPVNPRGRSAPVPPAGTTSPRDTANR
jgi:predicted CoA-binding protein